MVCDAPTRVFVKSVKVTQDVTSVTSAQRKIRKKDVPYCGV